MNHLFISLALLMTTLTHAQNGEATTTKKAFSRETTVAININSESSIIWTLLTNASDYTRWNSTVTSLEGQIELGKKIKLKSILDDKRTFKLKIKELEAGTKMTWGDGKGNRVYTLKENDDGTITFTMTEKIGGLMFPMYAKYIPPFDNTFEQFAMDLKAEAEIISNFK